MSLQITTQLTTESGIKVDNAYARVLVVNPFIGTQVQAVAAIFATEQDFLDGNAELKIKELQTSAGRAYDYATGDKNILDLAHDILIENFKAQGVDATKNL